VLRSLSTSAPLPSAIASAIAEEFPTITIEETPATPAITIDEAQWESGRLDTWEFDLTVDAAAETPAFSIAIDGSGLCALEVLNRVQRAIGRTNAASSTPLFDCISRRHRAMHDVSRPLVRADLNHSRDVWQWVLRLAPDASLELQAAALFHDIERLATESDERIEHEAPDYLRFKMKHARDGAGIAAAILRLCDAPESTIARSAWLVAEHEQPGDDEELAILNDADALSFFGLNSRGYADYFGEEQTRKKIEYTLRRLRPVARHHLRQIRLRHDVREWLAEAVGP
jgi:hypothetical protein